MGCSCHEAEAEGRGCPSLRSCRKAGDAPYRGVDLFLILQAHLYRHSIRGNQARCKKRHLFAYCAFSFVKRLINDREGWAIITPPRRRTYNESHFSSAVCRLLSDSLGLPFWENAVQCVNRNRLNPEFHLLRPISERKVIIFDDIITTGSTLTATASLLSDREMIVNLIGINNR